MAAESIRPFLAEETYSTAKSKGGEHLMRRKIIDQDIQRLRERQNA